MKTMRMDWMLGFAAAALLAAGCGREARDVFQGYAEADYVDVATAEPGQLESLGAAKGDSIDIVVSGEGADSALLKLVGLVKDGFGED